MTSMFPVISTEVEEV